MQRALATPNNRLEPLEVSMDHVSNSNAFNVLFILTFFASIAITFLRFG